MKKLIYNLMVLAAIVFQGCRSGKEVPYTIAQNYFVKNNVEAVDQPLIDNQAEFDSIFGMATVQGENGKPTPIDWEKQFVIAIVPDGTNEYVEIDPMELVKTENGLGLRYKLKNGEKSTSSMRPSLILVVDRQYQTRIVSVIEE